MMFQNCRPSQLSKKYALGSLGSSSIEKLSTCREENGYTLINIESKDPNYQALPDRCRIASDGNELRIKLVAPSTPGLKLDVALSIYVTKVVSAGGDSAGLDLFRLGASDSSQFRINTQVLLDSYESDPAVVFNSAEYVQIYSGNSVNLKMLVGRRNAYDFVVADGCCSFNNSVIVANADKVTASSVSTVDPLGPPNAELTNSAIDCSIPASTDYINVPIYNEQTKGTAAGRPCRILPYIDSAAVPHADRTGLKVTSSGLYRVLFYAPVDACIDTATNNRTCGYSVNFGNHDGTSPSIDTGITRTVGTKQYKVYRHEGFLEASSPPAAETSAVGYNFYAGANCSYECIKNSLMLAVPVNSLEP